MRKLVLALALFSTPALAAGDILMHRDRRLGVCLDVGWITAAGFDAAKVFREYEGRVFDIHLKDKKVEPGVGEPVAADTHIGQGNANLTGLFAELKKANWQGTLSLETDSQVFAQNPADFPPRLMVTPCLPPPRRCRFHRAQTQLVLSERWYPHVVREGYNTAAYYLNVRYILPSALEFFMPVRSPATAALNDGALLVAAPSRRSCRTCCASRRIKSGASRSSCVTRAS